MEHQKLKLAIFISGRGSNMSALIEACNTQDFPAEIQIVLSNKPDAPGLQIAQNARLQTVIVDHKNFSDRELFEDALQETLKKHHIDLICLAGFMRVLTSHFIDKWPDKIINIHPSLLPDYKGLHTHERVIADKGQQSGCTVHYVVPEMDAGPIIIQKTVPVLPNDTPDTLAARILEQEHIAYPEAVRIIAQTR